MRDSAWLAGFTDGEGCFTLAFKRQAVRLDGKTIRHDIVGVQPRFDIGLRADDRAILEAIRHAFGGTVHHAPRPRNSTGNRQDRCQWLVGAKADLLGLVDYFDRFPLLSKKARDFQVWREAVLIYVEHGARHPRLRDLRIALMEGRRFQGAGRP